MKMQKQVGILAVLLMTAGAAFAQDHILAEAARSTETSAAGTNAAPPADKEFHSRFPRYKIEPGDSMDVSFELNPEFNQTVSVQPDGFISLRGVGDVDVDRGVRVAGGRTGARKARSRPTCLVT